MSLLLFIAAAIGYLGVASASPSLAVEGVTTLKCDTSKTEYYSIKSFVEPFGGSSVPSTNATRVESSLSLGCINKEVSHSGKRFQEWRMDLCSLQVHQPCPSREWGTCTEDYSENEAWTEGSNTAYFYVETYPNPGNIYWDPSTLADESGNCFSKYSTLQQLQGALTNQFSPDIHVKQDNKIVDGILLNSVRFESSERPGNVKIPNNSMNAHIEMEYATKAVCASRVPTTLNGAPITTPRLPEASMIHILSPEAVCPNTKAVTSAIARSVASCDEKLESLLDSFFQSADEKIYGDILKCLDAEDRVEFMDKYTSSLENYFRSAHSSNSQNGMRDAISLMITLPSKNAIERAVSLIDSISSSATYDVVLSLSQMIAYSPVVQSVGIPSSLNNIVERYARSEEKVARYNAVLILASIARRTGVLPEVLFPAKVNQLPVLVRLDVLRNAGNAYSQNDFWQVLLSYDMKEIKSSKLIQDAISNRSDKNTIRTTLFEKFTDIPSFQWNVSVPEFSIALGSKDLLGADYAHKAYAGLSYESCNDHDVRKFKYQVDANTHLNLYYLDNTYQLFEVIIDESGSSDSTARTDYVRLVWRNDVYYNGPVINLDCRSIHLNLFNKRFNYPTASAHFQIGPVPIRVSMLGSATVDVQFDGEVCPLQGTVKGLLDPSVYNTVTGSACAGIVALKACIEVSGSFKADLKPGFEASITTCPHLSVCPTADLTFTNNELKIEGVIKYRSIRKSQELRKTFGDWKFKDVVKPLIENGKCIKI